MRWLKDGGRVKGKEGSAAQRFDEVAVTKAIAPYS